MSGLGFSEREKLKRMYNEGYTYEEIGDELHVTVECVFRHVKTMKELGILQPRKQKRTGRKKLCDVDGMKPTKPKRTYNRKAPEDHKGEGVYCDVTVARTCIWGCNSYETDATGLCNFYYITNIRRGCDACNCTRYEKRTPDNPKRALPYSELCGVMPRLPRVDKETRKLVQKILRKNNERDTDET